MTSQKEATPSVFSLYLFDFVSHTFVVLMNLQVQQGLQ